MTTDGYSVPLWSRKTAIKLSWKLNIFEEEKIDVSVCKLRPRTQRIELVEYRLFAQSVGKVFKYSCSNCQIQNWATIHPSCARAEIRPWCGYKVRPVLHVNRVQGRVNV